MKSSGIPPSHPYLLLPKQPTTTITQIQSKKPAKIVGIFQLFW